jgi:hypothetical protein
MHTYGVQLRDGSFAIMEALRSSSNFDAIWTRNLFAPFCVFAILFPMMNLPNPEPVVHFNAIGVIALIYSMFFIIFHFFKWGVNVNVTDSNNIGYVLAV